MEGWQVAFHCPSGTKNTSLPSTYAFTIDSKGIPAVIALDQASKKVVIRRFAPIVTSMSAMITLSSSSHNNVALFWEFARSGRYDHAKTNDDDFNDSSSDRLSAIPGFPVVNRNDQSS
jgi:hypothetical protein